MFVTLPGQLSDVNFLLIISILKPGRNGRHFALKFVCQGPVDNKPALVQVMVWRRNRQQAITWTNADQDLPWLVWKTWIWLLKLMLIGHQQAQYWPQSQIYWGQHFIGKLESWINPLNESLFFNMCCVTYSRGTVKVTFHLFFDYIAFDYCQSSNSLGYFWHRYIKNVPMITCQGFLTSTRNVCITLFVTSMFFRGNMMLFICQPLKDLFWWKWSWFSLHWLMFFL